MKKVILIVVVLALVGGAGFGGMMMGKKMGTKAAPEAPADVTDELAADAEGGEAKAEGGEGGEKAEGGEKPAAGAHGEKTEGGEAAGGEAKVSKLDLIYKFDDKFTANLVDPNGRLFVQTGLQLQASSVGAKQQIEENVAPLRDAILMLLSSKRREEIEPPAGRERFKRELMARVEGILEPEALSNIYFYDFMVIKQ